MEMKITKSEMCYDNIDKLPKCIHEYKKTSPFYNESCRKCIAYRVCGGSCVYDKLTRFGCADIQDKCRLVCISPRSLQLINKNIIKEIEN